jgi:hypothetical protein
MSDWRALPEHGNVEVTPNSPTFSQPVTGFHVDSVHSIPDPWAISARPSATVGYPPGAVNAATAQS